MADIQITEPYLTVIRHTMLIRQYLQAEDARMTQEVQALLQQLPDAAKADAASIHPTSVLIRLGDAIRHLTIHRAYVQGKDQQLENEIFAVLEHQFGVTGVVTVDLATGIVSTPEPTPGTVPGVPMVAHLDVHTIADALVPHTEEGDEMTYDPINGEPSDVAGQAPRPPEPTPQEMPAPEAPPVAPADPVTPEADAAVQDAPAPAETPTGTPEPPVV